MTQKHPATIAASFVVALSVHIWVSLPVFFLRTTQGGSPSAQVEPIGRGPIYLGEPLAPREQARPARRA